MAVSGILVEADNPRELLYPSGWADRLTDWIDSLSVSTRPWQLGTISVLATALLLPILLWFIDRLLQRLVGF